LLTATQLWVLELGQQFAEVIPFVAQLLLSALEHPLCCLVLADFCRVIIYW